MKNYNTSEPPKQLTETVCIGWHHHLEKTEAGQEIVYDLNAAGERIPKTYEIVASLSTNDILAIYKNLGPDAVADLPRRLIEGDIEVVVELAGAVFGNELVMAIAKDPTVDTAAFMSFCADALATLGFGETVPDPKAAA